MHLATTLKAALPKIVQDYIDQNEDLADCYSFEHSFSGLKAASEARKARAVSCDVLANELDKQARESKFVSQLVLDNIASLKRGAQTVTTGHQLCVYGGPLFFFHKILSAIALSNRLRESGIDAIPVYWMASEDHDFEEINHVFIGSEKVVWNKEASGPVGKLDLTDLVDFKQKLSELFQSDPLKTDLLKKLDIVFSSDKSLAEAMRDFVYWIFADQGVVVIDADSTELKRQFIPVLKQELESQFSFNELERINQRLSAKDYNVQVEGREINLFFMEKGYRERIVKSNDGFATADGENHWKADEMIGLVESNPEKFSPNVVLRPVYQEVILPNIAYIGGPGELSYWLQLKPVFKACNVFFPAILLRDMVLIVDQKIQKRKNQLKLEYADFRRSHDEVLTQIVRQEGSHEFIVDQKLEQVEALLNQLQTELGALNRNLETSAETERNRIVKRLKALQKKTLRFDKNKADIADRRITEAQNALFPFNAPQERIHNWLQFSNDPKTWVSDLSIFYNLFDLGTKVIED